MKRRALTLLAALWLAGSAGQAGARDATQLAVSLPDGAILIEHEADAPRRPASLVKLMTGYVAFEALDSGEIDEDDSITISRAASRQPPVKLGLRKGEKIPFRELLAAGMVGSKNDAAFAVAEAVAGSEDAFIERMNRTARRLGLTNTRYSTVTGLPRAGQHTTARDIALLAKALLDDFPERSLLFSRRSVRAKGRSVSTTNPLFGRVPGAEGLKTGFTCAAGYSIAALVEKDGRKLLAVTLGHPSKGERLSAIKGLINAAADVPNGNTTLRRAKKSTEGPPDIRACSGRGAEIVASDIPVPVDADLYLAGVAVPPRPLDAPKVVEPETPIVAEPERPNAAPQLSASASRSQQIRTPKASSQAQRQGQIRATQPARVPIQGAQPTARQAQRTEPARVPIQGAQPTARQAQRTQPVPAIANDRQRRTTAPLSPIAPARRVERTQQRPQIAPPRSQQLAQRVPKRIVPKVERPKPPPPLHGWAAFLGAFDDLGEAQRALATVIERTSKAQKRYGKTLRRSRDGRALAIIYGLSREGAGQYCSIAKSLRLYCLSLNPQILVNERARWRR